MVESPGGATGTIDAALRVSEGVESIQLTASPLVQQVDQPIEVTVSLVDEDGVVVDGPLDITIVATDADGQDVGILYDASDLEDAVPDAAGTVTGTVPEDGVAVLMVAHGDIEEVTLSAVPTDPTAAPPRTRTRWARGASSARSARATRGGWPARRSPSRTTRVSLACR